MAIRVEDLSVSMAGKPILHSISFTHSGGVLFLMGENGSGKSTLLRALATLQEFQSGSVTLNGMLFGETNLDLFRTQIGYLGQFATFPRGFTVDESLRYGCWLRKIPRGEVGRAIERACALAALSDVRDRKIGGATQRRWQDLSVLTCGVLFVAGSSALMTAHSGWQVLRAEVLYVGLTLLFGKVVEKASWLPGAVFAIVQWMLGTDEYSEPKAWAILLHDDGAVASWILAMVVFAAGCILCARDTR